MLCFFFISDPNYKAYVANGWPIIRVRLRIETCVSKRATCPPRAVTRADKGGHSNANGGPAFKSESAAG
ncbi:hypothetical protein OH687_20530 [Burkholderia anthina]|nr:hypothetical protein OH687_20530 [Burkholderia anthina]